jgi:hypothetical protein
MESVCPIIGVTFMLLNFRDSEFSSPCVRYVRQVAIWHGGFVCDGVAPLSKMKDRSKK